jgi:hypothetical protein
LVTQAAPETFRPATAGVLSVSTARGWQTAEPAAGLSSRHSPLPVVQGFFDPPPVPFSNVPE